MRNKAVFGEDAENFRPERWLVEDEKERKRLEDGWIVFGRGSRACIGKEIALTVTTKAVVEVCPFVGVRSCCIEMDSLGDFFHCSLTKHGFTRCCEGGRFEVMRRV